MSDIKQEMDQVIRDLESQGVNANSHVTNDVVGLGDVVESHGGVVALPLRSARDVR